jgi:hypothetical protein
MSATMTDVTPDEQWQEQKDAAEAEAHARAGDDVQFAWLASNRVDDQVVLFEQDDAHPGGECFIGGGGLDYCARTPAVERLLREGVLLELQEPPAGRKRPLVLPTGNQGATRDVPGTPSRLGRKLDPDLVTAQSAKQIEAQQDRAPADIPVPPQVEKPPEPREDQPAPARARR